jgi:hypothetical protein
MSIALFTSFSYTVVMFREVSMIEVSDKINAAYCEIVSDVCYTSMCSMFMLAR